MIGLYVLKKMKSPEDRLRKGIKTVRWARWLILALGCFQIVASFVVYSQGNKISELIGKDDYGTLFWNGVDIDDTYTGWEIKAENRFAASFLYLGSGVFLCILGLSSFVTLKHKIELLEIIEKSNREPVAGVNSVTSLRDSTP